jgi:hypothetical protein
VLRTPTRVFQIQQDISQKEEEEQDEEEEPELSNIITFKKIRKRNVQH